MRLVSTRDPQHPTTFLEAVQRGLAPDGGLYTPDPLACFRDAERLLDLDFPTRNLEIMTRLLGDELSRDELEPLMAEAFNFPAPLVQVRDRVFVLELFHGPSLAFKDFGARFLAQILGFLNRREGRLRTVLTATSGDTGAAVAQAFWRKPGFRVVVLYPKGRITDLQERQIATLGDNVLAFAVDGSFDDCQALVKGAFADPELSKRLGLISANSINIARLLAQVLYYWEALAQLEAWHLRDDPVFAVPSGNFGNLTAGMLAERMGLPVKCFVVATNANRTVPDFLDTGEWRPRPGQPTLSSAMDVGDPSNWERILHLYGGRRDRLRAALRWGSRSDAETRQTLWELRGTGYQTDPHGAVAYGVLTERLGLNETGIFLGTAHPAKFEELLRRDMNQSLDLPPGLAGLQEKPLLSRGLENSPAALRAMLEG